MARIKSTDPEHLLSEKQTLLWSPHLKAAVQKAAQDENRSINNWVITVLSERLHELELL